MDLQHRRFGAVNVVSAVGRIDHSSADAFHAALSPHVASCRESTPALVIDMSKVEYISSVGLRALMVAAKTVKSQGGRIAIAALSPIVKEIFEISRFNLVFDLFDSVADAERTHGSGS